MNQKKLAVWITVLFLITACANMSVTGTNFPNQVANNNSCSASVTIRGKAEAAPGETISLWLSQTSLVWQYEWTASEDSFLSSPQESTTDLTVPQTEGSVEVFVSVTNAEGCKVATDSITIVVASPATSTPTATETAQPTSTPTLTVAPTDIPTLQPSATHTLVPTLAFTNTPFPTPLPSHTPTPTVPAFTILLQEPKDDTCVGSDNAVFEWLATRPLNTIEGINGEYFAINIWSDDSPRYSVSWIKNPRYEIDNITDPIAAYTQQINCSSEKGCYWSVDMIVSRVERGSGWKPESFTLVASSQIRKFCTYANPAPPPTNTPVPSPTPCNLPSSQCN
ncbi:MAG: hypothetical protein IPM53_27830 [Anaerolineaceae bacterium]|nr:hypothetical protein [Anaerolineaceae bacterium]